MPTVGRDRTATANADVSYAGTMGFSRDAHRSSATGSGSAGSAQVIVISDSEQSEESSDAPVAPAEGDAGENNCTSLKEASDCQAASDGARAADFQIPDSTEHLLCLSEMD